MWLRNVDFNRFVGGFVVALATALLTSASAQTLERALMPGEVFKGHAKWEDQCKACHAPFEKNAQDGLCLDCHKDIAKDLQQKRGLHGKQNRAACRSCHTDHKGRNAQIASFDTATFRHDALTEFRLNGAHKTVKCASCHAPSAKYRDAQKTCIGCHQKDDTHKGGLGAKCESCHNESKWSDVRFDHNKETKFELLGGHAKVKCASCHVGGKYKNTPTTCVGCHKKDDKHKGTLGDRCDACHGVSSWKAEFNHDTDTKFALRGKHRGVRCESCHVSPPNKVKLATTCVSCHQKDDKHQGSLGNQCGDCHTERKWTDTKFDHSTTGFKLDGKHADAECKSCHPKAPNFKGASKECFACHQKDDKHKGNLGKDCGGCHTAKNWMVANYDHSKTRFPLLGKHRTAKCSACHTQPDRYRDLALSCISCHKKDDSHKGNYGEKCETCHNADDWKKAFFDHNRLTKFPLRGGHVKPKCGDCHTKPLYPNTIEKTCVSCHKKDDTHKGSLGNDCETCHSDVNWKIALFDHNKTKYPLTGAHRAVKCADCHKDTNYRATLKTCIGCHKKEDIHKEALGEKCESCHVTRSWAVWSFDHDRATKFVLDGAHRKTSCAACHTQPLKEILGARCDTCHARDDVHNGGFGRRCDQCHLTSDWKSLKLGAKGVRK